MALEADLQKHYPETDYLKKNIWTDPLSLMKHTIRLKPAKQSFWPSF